MILPSLLSAVFVLLPLVNCQLVKSPPDLVPLCEDNQRLLDFTTSRYQNPSRRRPNLTEPSGTDTIICINLTGNNLTNVSNWSDFGSLEYLNLALNNLSSEFLSSYGHPTIRTLILDEAFAQPLTPPDEDADGVSEDSSQESTYIPWTYTFHGRRKISYGLKMTMDFPQLTHLFLRKNHLKRLVVPSWLDTLPNITHLYLNDNELSSSNFLQQFPETLTHLYLSNNDLSIFKTGSLKNLKVLQADINPLGYVHGSEEFTRGISLTTAVNLQELSLSSAALLGVDEKAMENLTSLEYLDLSNNELSEIPEKVFQNLRHLRSLRLDNNELKGLPDLHNLGQLEELNLRQNRLHGFRPKVFSNLRSLRYLDLSDNRFYRVSRGELQNLTSLVTLKARNTFWRDIPDICGSKNLTELTLSGNRIRVISRQRFCDLADLRHIDLSHNDIVKMTPEVFSALPSLATLDLSWNKLETCQGFANFGVLQRLEYLNLSGNALRPECLASFGHPTMETLVLDQAIAEIDCPLPVPEEEVGTDISGDLFWLPPGGLDTDEKLSSDYLKISLQFPRLKHLYLRGNNLKLIRIPSWSDSLPAITHLHLSNNRLLSTGFLSTFPKNLTHLYIDRNLLMTFRTGSLRSLEVLHVDHNLFGFVCGSEYCPQGIWLKEAINLRELSLSFANLHTLMSDSMKDLMSLESLDLSNNKLTEIPRLAFRNLESLRVLRLTQNKLGEIPDLTSLETLEELNLSHNEIRSISQSVFSNSKNLRHIDLSHNEIAEITSGEFEMLPSLRTLDISWNNLKIIPLHWLPPRNPQSPSFYVKFEGNPLAITEER